MQYFIRQLTRIVKPQRKIYPIDNETIHQAILDISDLQARIDSIRITLVQTQASKRQSWEDS